MAKVLLISGSPKKEGNTMQTLQKCAAKIDALGLEAEIISLAGRKIEACIACGKCIGKGVCVLNDDLNEVADKVREARGLILGSPVYFGTARGDLMNLLQRVGMLSYNGDRFLSYKVGGPIAINRRGGATATIQEMLMFFFINEMIVPGSTYWNIMFGKKPGEAMDDEEGVRTAERFAENVAHVILQMKEQRPE
ncbi:flavodoxin family protein [Dethiobacter alkaliphilus]|uniref:flavodoxin family protein n=1 Tax=Dethiobacter alkaliphilus TaxID=427926 RepID=UPI002227D957|nr:flavodoxin family protein [Dethiobacter alkaliphilus]MCW3489879.1 flavodoxin family protein [Dethiobacter alkaliphilus]